MTVTRGSIVPDTDDLGDVIIRVHGPSLADDAAIFEKTVILGDRCTITLSITVGIVTGVDVALDPSVNMSIAAGASKDGLSTDDSDDSWNVSGPNVVEYNRRFEPSSGFGTSVEDGGIRHDSIDDCNSTDTVNIDLESNLRVVDSDPLEIPAPIPKHFDSGVRVVDGDVSDGKLLISNVETSVSAVDDEVAHKTATEDPM